MKYIGSKARIAKEILPIILEGRTEDQYYVEPFIGGANTISKVDGDRIGGDSNKYLIALYKALQNGWQPFQGISKELYNEIRDNKYKYEAHIVGYVGFAFSFGAKFFGGFVGTVNDRARKRDRLGEGYRNVLKTIDMVKDIDLHWCDYKYLQIPDNSIIYCDPPYKDVYNYGIDFSHYEFWEWCRYKAKKGHRVFISEYQAPADFTCVWEKEMKCYLAKDKVQYNVEKLFTYEKF